jgi:hypothetical protein
LRKIARLHILLQNISLYEGALYVFIEGGESQNKRKHNSGNGIDKSKALQAAEYALYQEMKFAADVLYVNPPMDISERLIHVQFIKECAETIKSLQNINV